MENGKIITCVSNEVLMLNVFEKPFCGTIHNKVTGEVWQFDMERSLSYTLSDGKIYNDSIIFGVEPLRNGTAGAQAQAVLAGEHFHLNVWLDSKEPDVLFELEPLDCMSSAMERIQFPGPILPLKGSVTELVLPMMATQGLSHVPKAEEEWHKEFMLYEYGLSMPVWGTFGSAGGMLTIVNTPYDCGVIIDKKKNHALTIEPYWVPSLGRYDTARRMTASFTYTQHYAEMARRYRQYIVSAGRFKSLKQKIEERPAVKKLIGAPYVYLGYQPLNEKMVTRVMDGMKAMGYDTCLFGPLSVNSWDNQWMNDYIPLINLSKQIYQHGEDIGYLPYAWEWLEDMMVSNRFYQPDMPYIKSDGKNVEGWSNRDYRYQMVCSKILAEYYKKLLPEVTHAPALHMDVTTHAPVRECWNHEHAFTRTQDVQFKRDRMKGYAAAGKVFGSEGGYDWAFDLYDFCSTNPRIGSLTNSDNRYIPVPNRLIPFMSIVYHDSVLMYWYEQDTYMRDRNDMMKWFHHVEPGVANGEYRDKLLFDIMAGNPPTLSPCGAVFDMNMLDSANDIQLKWVTYDAPGTQAILKDALQVAKNHVRVALMQITDQQYLDEHRLVSRTVYEDGTAVYVNFSSEPYRTESGETVLPQDWLNSSR